jgi:hypothetical protein
MWQRVTALERRRPAVGHAQFVSRRRRRANQPTDHFDLSSSFTPPANWSTQLLRNQTQEKHFQRVYTEMSRWQISITENYPPLAFLF